MNCQDVINLLDSAPSVALSAEERERLADHRRVCESCEHAWLASETLRSFGETAVPPPRADFLQETMRVAAPSSGGSRRGPPSFWLGGALGAALAAGMAIVAVFGTYPSASREHGNAPETLAIALYETRAITLAIDSAESLRGARIRVAVSGGIELANPLRQQDIRWVADIDAGTNRLTIPVVAVRSEDAELFVEVEHGSRHRHFRIRVDVVAAADASDLAIG